MILTLAGKLLSLLANQAYLSYFGADDPYLNIFSWVLQIPNYLFQSLGTGLTSVVIPVYAAALAEGRTDEANRFGSNLICICMLGVSLLVAVSMALGPVLPQFTDFRDKDYGAMALRIMMPVMFFYALTNIYQGILQSLGRFTVSALVNLPSGIVILLYLSLFAQRFGVTGLLVAVVIGLFLQFAILPLPARQAGFRFRPMMDLRDPQVRTVGKMMIPVVLGASAYQINMFFNNTMMSSVAPESVSLFNFVQTLILSSVMVLVNAITSVKYPVLTYHAAKDDMMGFRRELSGTMGTMIFILTPITFGLVSLGRPLLELISLHGKVTAQHISTETMFLLMYCPCIVALGLKEIADRALYSLRITKTSGGAGVVILAVNVVLGYILSCLTPLGSRGIPLAYSIAIIAETVILLIRLKQRILFFSGDLKATAVKSVLCSGGMSLCVTAVHRFLEPVFSSGSILSRLMLVLIPTAVGMVFYFSTTYLAKTTPIRDFAARKGDPK